MDQRHQAASAAISGEVVARLHVLDPARMGRLQPSSARVLLFEVGLSRPAKGARKPRYCGASSAVMLLVSIPSLPAIVSAITLRGIPVSPTPCSVEPAGPSPAPGGRARRCRECWPPASGSSRYRCRPRPRSRGKADQRVREAVVVESLWTIGASRMTEERTPCCLTDRMVRRVHAGATLGLIILGSRAAGDPGHREHQRPAGGDEGLVAADQALADGPVAVRSQSTAPMKSPVRIALCLKARWMTPSASAAAPPAVEVVEVAAANLGAHGSDGLADASERRGRPPDGRC